MDFQPLTVTGVVSLATRDQGSKSERSTLVLQTGDGQTFVLRQQAAPSFGDHSLDQLVGKTIKTDGFVKGSTLVVRSFEIIDPSR